MKTVRTAPDALPGLLEIYAIPLHNIQKLNGTSIFIFNHSDYYKIIFSHDSLQHLVKQSLEGNNVFLHSIGGFVFGSDVYNQSLFEEMSSLNHMLVLRNDDGTWKRIGDKDTGLAFEFDFNTDTPGLSFAFTGTLRHNSLPASLPFL